MRASRVLHTPSVSAYQIVKTNGRRGIGETKHALTETECSRDAYPRIPPAPAVGKRTMQPHCGLQTMYMEVWENYARMRAPCALTSREPNAITEAAEQAAPSTLKVTPSGREPFDVACLCGACVCFKRPFRVTRLAPTAPPRARLPRKPSARPARPRQVNAGGRGCLPWRNARDMRDPRTRAAKRSERRVASPTEAGARMA